MTKIQILREFVNKRLIDVAEEICDIFERTFAEFEEEANRSRKEIDHQHTTRPPIVSVKEEEILPEQQHCTEWRPSLEDQDPEPPQTPDELRHGHERLQTWEEEADTMRSSTCVKSEYDYSQPSLLYLSQNEEYNGHSLLGGVSEPSSQNISPDCSVVESNENGNNNCRENEEPLSSFKTHMFSSCHTKEGPYICNGCGKEFYQSSTCIRENPYNCDECVEIFKQNMGIVSDPLAEGKAAYHMVESSMHRGKKRIDVENRISNEHKRLIHLSQSYINSKSVLAPGKRLREKNCAYCRYKCNANFPESERENIFRHFWGIGDSVRQKHFIIAHVLKRDKKRHTTEKDSRRQYSIEYFFTSQGRKIRVCKDFFLRTLDVSGTFARSAMSMCPSLK